MSGFLDSYDFAGLRTVADAFERTAARSPGHDCICIPARAGRDYAPEGLTWSYEEVRQRTARLREVYRQAGYGHGHRVAILLENRPSFIIHWLALNALGISTVPINPDSTVAEATSLVGRSGAVLAVALPERAGLLQTAAAQLERRPAVVGEEWPSSLPEAPVPPLATSPTQLSEVALLFTSGTSGVSKGAMLTNEGFLFNAERYIMAGGLMKLEYGVERMYNPLPLFYANAFAHSNIVMIMLAGCMIIPERFSASHWWPDVAATGATCLHHLGIIPPVLLGREPVPEERMHRVRFGLGGGIDPRQQVEWERRFGFPLIEVYGMTELGICSFASHEPRRIGEHLVGRPLAGTEFRIVHGEDKPVPVGEPGQVIVRRTGEDPRRGFLRGYLDGPDLTEEVWRGGWFHTGDVLRQDEHGDYYYVDRIKNMIRRSGQNIPAAEVENGLRGHPAVAEVACLPVPDELRQEEVMACIVAPPGVETSARTAHDLMDWALERVAYFKAPGWIVFLDDIPTTVSQKLQKDRIFEKGEDPRLRPRCFDMRDRKKRPAQAASA